MDQTDAFSLKNPPFWLQVDKYGNFLLFFFPENIVLQGGNYHQLNVNVKPSHFATLMTTTNNFTRVPFLTHVKRKLSLDFYPGA